MMYIAGYMVNTERTIVGFIESVGGRAYDIKTGWIFKPGFNPRPTSEGNGTTSVAVVNDAGDIYILVNDRWYLAEYISESVYPFIQAGQDGDPTSLFQVIDPNILEYLQTKVCKSFDQYRSGIDSNGAENEE